MAYLKVSKEIAAGTEVADTYTPASGKTIHIKLFECDGVPASINSVVKLVWKYNHGSESEVTIWTVKGDKVLRHRPDPITDCDGVRKFAVVCDNGESGAVYMSGYCEYDEE